MLPRQGLGAGLIGIAAIVFILGGISIGFGVADTFSSPTEPQKVSLLGESGQTISISGGPTIKTGIDIEYYDTIGIWVADYENGTVELTDYINEHDQVLNLPIPIELQGSNISSNGVVYTLAALANQNHVNITALDTGAWIATGITGEIGRDWHHVSTVQASVLLESGNDSRIDSPSGWSTYWMVMAIDDPTAQILVNPGSETDAVFLNCGTERTLACGSVPFASGDYIGTLQIDGPFATVSYSGSGAVLLRAHGGSPDPGLLGGGIATICCFSPLICFIGISLLVSTGFSGSAIASKPILTDSSIPSLAGISATSLNESAPVEFPVIDSTSLPESAEVDDQGNGDDHEAIEEPSPSSFDMNPVIEKINLLSSAHLSSEREAIISENSGVSYAFRLQVISIERTRGLGLAEHFRNGTTVVGNLEGTNLPVAVRLPVSAEVPIAGTIAEFVGTVADHSSIHRRTLFESNQ